MVYVFSSLSHRKSQELTEKVAQKAWEPEPSVEDKGATGNTQVDISSHLRANKLDCIIHVENSKI